MFSLICAWINDWLNNGKAGDFRSRRVHYDVTVYGWESQAALVSSKNGLVCQKQVSRAGTSNYITKYKYLWEVITCPCPWNPLLTYKSSYGCRVCLAWPCSITNVASVTQGTQCWYTVIEIQWQLNWTWNIFRRPQVSESLTHKHYTHPVPLLQTWIISNSIMDKLLHRLWSAGWN